MIYRPYRPFGVVIPEDNVVQLMIGPPLIQAPSHHTS
jgi:hypothetical protein